MFTLDFIIRAAQSLDDDDIKEGKAYADRRMKWGLWWAYDCVKMYQYFLVCTNKIFWWSMVVKTLRYANYYHRRKVE